MMKLFKITNGRQAFFKINFDRFAAYCIGGQFLGVYFLCNPMALKNEKALTDQAVDIECGCAQGTT